MPSRTQVGPWQRESGRRGDRQHPTDRLHPVDILVMVDVVHHHLSRRWSSAAKTLADNFRMELGRRSSRSSGSSSAIPALSAEVCPRRGIVAGRASDATASEDVRGSAHQPAVEVSPLTGGVTARRCRKRSTRSRERSHLVVQHCWHPRSNLTVLPSWPGTPVASRSSPRPTARETCCRRRIERDYPGSKITRKGRGA